MRKTMAKRLRRSVKAFWSWCRMNRHTLVHEQHQTLCKKLQGYYGYYGIRGNYRMLEVIYNETLRAWRRWLGQRSRKGYLNFKAFVKFLERYPLPLPRIVHAV